MNFTKAMPNFLAVMAGGGSAPDVGGIEGALQRHAQREREVEDREDDEDEAPLVVDAAEALTAKERRKLEGAHSGASLRFKDDKSAAAKFVDSAHEHIVTAEQRQAEAAEKAAKAEAEAEAEAAASGKAHLFKAGAVRPPKLGGKRKEAAAGALVAPKAKAVKNAKLLSFDEEDE